MSASIRTQLTRYATVQETNQVRNYKNDAFEDYLTARVLFNAGRLQQACVLANTCIEKEIKAYLLFHGIKSKTHDTFNLYNQMTRRNPGIKNTINRSFIEILTKLHKTRYTEDLPVGFNYVICRNKFLAELDFTYSELEAITKVSNTAAPEAKSMFQRNIDAGNEYLFEDNYLLNNIDKDDFLNQPDLVYEIRLVSGPNGTSILSATYTISHNPDKLFIHDALKLTPVPGSSSGEMQAHPIYKNFIL